jgi:hypothetical protein
MKILYVLSLILLLYCATTLALQDSLLLKLLAPLFRLRKIAVTVAKPLKLFQGRKIAFLVAAPVVYQYALIGGSALASHVPASAQQPEKMRRIGPRRRLCSQPGRDQAHQQSHL